MMKQRFLKAGLTLALLAAWSPACIAQAQPAPDAHAILVKIEARNPSLRTFQSRVHVDVRMKNFPFLSPKLDGTSYFKRPNNYEVVFDRVPSYAKGFERLFSDVADAGSWERENVVSYDGQRIVDGRPFIALRLTKKIYSDQLDHATAYVDPNTFQIARMDWAYRNGGTVVMTQTYKAEAGYNVVASQHAEIAIPHVRAVADAIYGHYQTNVAVVDAVFAKK